MAYTYKEDRIKFLKYISHQFEFRLIKKKEARNGK